MTTGSRTGQVAGTQEEGAMRKRAANSKNTYRNRSGQAMAEGAAMLVVMSIFLVLGILLLVNCGVAAFYKQKIAAISTAAANFAATQPKEIRQAETEQYVREAVTTMGLAYSNVAVPAVETVKIHGQDTVCVHLKVNGLPLVGQGFGLICVEDTGISTGSGMQVTGYYNITKWCTDGSNYERNFGTVGTPGSSWRNRPTETVWVPVVSQPTACDRGPLNLALQEDHQSSGFMPVPGM
jgi:hypothetical protein